MKDKYIDTIKNSFIINILCILGVITNIFLLFSYDPRSYIIGLSIVSILILYICLITYKAQFSFPLIFVRDELSFWGGLTGGMMSLLSCVLSYLLVLKYELLVSEIVSLFILFICLLITLTISYTATIINDIKNTDYI